MRETNGNFDSCNSCRRLVPSRLHELHESKFPFVSRIEFIRSKLSNFSAHVSGVSASTRHSSRHSYPLSLHRSAPSRAPSVSPHCPSRPLPPPLLHDPPSPSPHLSIPPPTLQASVWRDTFSPTDAEMAVTSLRRRRRASESTLTGGGGGGD